MFLNHCYSEFFNVRHSELLNRCHSEFLNVCHSERSEESAVVGKPRKCSRTAALSSGFGWRSAFRAAANADGMNEGFSR